MQTKREQWASRLAAWRSSGLSQSAWCREHGVSLASLCYWRRKLGGDERAAAVTAVLPIQREAPPAAEGWEACLPNGIVLRMGSTDPAVLLPWLRALAAC